MEFTDEMSTMPVAPLGLLTFTESAVDSVIKAVSLLFSNYIRIVRRKCLSSPLICVTEFVRFLCEIS